MKKNLYYRTVFRRENILKNKILDFFLFFASYPRLLLEVFIRKNFGQRYFSFASVVTVCIILVSLPVIQLRVASALSPFDKLQQGQMANPFGGMINPNRNGNSTIFPMNLPRPEDASSPTPTPISNSYENRNSSPPEYKYITWYIFLIAFFIFAYRRLMEVESIPSAFDFSRFSLSTGEVQMSLFKPKVATETNMRRIETYYEPMLFFIPGLILGLVGQPIGWVLVLSSICYGMSYAAAYRNGDNFILDKIDEMIVNEEMANAFVEDQDPSQTRGVRFFADKPSAKNMREKVMESFVTEDDNISEAI